MSIPTPQSKADMDPVFEKCLRQRQQQAAQEYAQRTQVGQVRWDRPPGWNGDLFDVEGLAAPFDRSKANQFYIDAVSKPTSPGTSGDIIATTTMIDVLANLERATRARYMRRPRAVAHMLARKKGHGSPTGVFIQNFVEYVRSILKQAKVAP
jgi:hypothetical protein